MRKAFLSVFITLFFLSSTITAFAYDPRYLFTDHEKDTESGLYDFGARQYNPNIGKFIQPDPVLNNLTNPQVLKQQTNKDLQEFLKDPQGLNSYGYARNNPIRYIDPTGKWFQEFFTGRQSWSSFQTELGEAAMYVNPIMSAAINHPYITGVAAGILSGALFVGTSLMAGGGFICGILCGTTATTAVSQGDKIVGQTVRLLNPAIKITEKALTKISQIHQGAYDGTKSVFYEGENIVELIRGTTQNPMVTQIGDKFARIVDIGRNIGIDRLTGQQTHMITVITNAANELITAYPGVPSYLIR